MRLQGETLCRELENGLKQNADLQEECEKLQMAYGHCNERLTAKYKAETEGNRLLQEELSVCQRYYIDFLAENLSTFQKGAANPIT